MQVSFQLSVAEIEALTRSRPLRSRWILGWVLGFCSLAGCFLVPTLVLASLQIWYGIAVGGALFVLMFYAWISQFFSNRDHWRQVGGKLEKGLTTYLLTPEQLECSSPLVHSRRAWSEVSKAVHTDTHLLLFFGRAFAAGIPHRAFGSQQEAEQFASLVDRYRGQSRNAERYSPTPTWLPVDEDFVCVRYQTTASEQIAFAQYGLQNAPRSRRVPKSFGYLVVFVGGLIVAIGAQGTPWVLQIFAGLIVYLALGLPSLAVIRQIYRAWTIWRFDKRTLRPRTVTVSPVGVHTFDGISEVVRFWPLIDGIAMDGNFVVIYEVKPNVAHLIPRRAFDSGQAAEHFFRRATMYWEGAREPLEEIPPADDPNNPYQSPMTK
jgi:hypothetical protein